MGASAEVGRGAEAPRASRLLVYDGSCPFCVALSGWLVRRGVIAEDERRPFQAFDGGDAERLLEAGIRDEVLLLQDGRIRSGLDALLDLFAATRVRLLTFVLRLPPFRFVADLLYRTLAHNRRILAPVSPEVSARCGCEPATRPGLEAGFALLSLVLALGGALLAGALASLAKAAGPHLPHLAVLSVAPLLPLLLGPLLRGAVLRHLLWIEAVWGLGALLASALALLASLALVSATGDTVRLILTALAYGLTLRMGLRRMRLGVLPVGGLLLQALARLAGLLVLLGAARAIGL